MLVSFIKREKAIRMYLCLFASGHGIQGFTNYGKSWRSNKAAVLFIKLCVRFTSEVAAQKVWHLSRQSTKCFSKSLGDHQDVLWQM